MVEGGGDPPFHPSTKPRRCRNWTPYDLAARSEEERTALAANLKAERQRLGWTQYDLAAASGIHQPDISDIERCDVSINPSRGKVKALADALGVDLSDLLKK